MSAIENAVWQQPTIRARFERTVTNLSRYGMVWVLLILVIGSQVMHPGFLAPENIRNILAQNSMLGIVAVAMTLVMIGGGFDLSVGAILALGAVLFATLTRDGWPIIVAAAIALLAGLIAGTVNGVLVTRLRINPFMATLGTSSAIAGLAALYTHSRPIFVQTPGFGTLGTERWNEIPYSVMILAAVFVVGAIVLARTAYGRSIHCVGGNMEAARLCGLRVDLVRASTYMLAGVCSALAGLIMSSQSLVAKADWGAMMALDAISVVVIGGTSIMGGEGAVWRSAVGLLIMATINNLFDALAIGYQTEAIIKGTILIGVVRIEIWIRSRK